MCPMRRSCCGWRRRPAARDVKSSAAEPASEPRSGRLPNGYVAHGRYPRKCASAELRARATRRAWSPTSRGRGLSGSSPPSRCQTGFRRRSSGFAPIAATHPPRPGRIDMFVDAIRAMRQVLLRQRREPPRLSRTSLIVFFAIMAGLFILYVEADGRENAPYASVHFAIVGLSLLHIMWVRRFNLGLSFSFFALFFFGIFPLFEYRLGITYSGANIPSDSSYMTAAILALVSSVCFYVGYGLKRGATFHMDMLKKLHFVSKRHRQLATWTSIATIAVMSAIVVYFYEFSLYKILFRGYGEEGEQSAIGYSFVNYVARPLIFNLIFLMVLMNTRRSHVQYSKVFVLCCFALLLVSPIGVPRSLAGALYIPLVMMAFIPRYNSKYTQLCVIVFAILFLAPLADVFRFINSQHEQMDLGSNFNLEYLFSGHFDAFHNLAQVID